MSDLTELIRDNFDVDPDVTAIAVFNAAGVPAKWRDLFYGVVRDECRRQSRHVVRLHERGMDDDEDSPTATTRSPTPKHGPSPWVNVNERTVYLADRMCINAAGEYRLKGSATADEWMQRAHFLAAQRDGLNVTIEDCEAVAKFLAESGVECLFDLPAVAA